MTGLWPLLAMASVPAFSGATERFDFDPRSEPPLPDPRDYRMDDHLHEGRLLHQYARQPRANAHRISRGRP